MAADNAPVTLRMGVLAPAAPAAPAAASAAAPESGSRRRARKKRSDMTRGEKAAATRRANKMRDISGTTRKVKAKGMRKPKNWDAMSRGEKASWTRKSNERKKKRDSSSPKSGSRKTSTVSGRGRGRGRGKVKDGKGHRVVERMSSDAAKHRLERIRAENPELADAMDQEIDARRDRQKFQGKMSKSAIVESLAATEDRNAGSIVKEGSVGGRILDGTIVIGTGLLSARLDEMIETRPLGLQPSDIMMIVEAIVLGVAVWKRSRKVARYAALSLTGTVGMKVVRAVGKRKAPPSP